MKRRTYPQPGPLNLRLTLGPLRRGPSDPCLRLADRAALWGIRTPDGPAALRLSVGAGEVTAEAAGAGAAWALENAPSFTGRDDRPEDFRPNHPVLERLSRELAGLRIAASLNVIDVLVPTILEQKVTGVEAKRSYAALVRRYGEHGPGGACVMIPPAPEVLAGLPYWAFHPLGVERKRADIIRRTCARAAGLASLVDENPDEARRRLTSIAGVGPWTAANVTFAALGDPDAVITGDYHIPHIVTWALEGRRRGTDGRMVELLEPYRGQRGRAIRLLTVGTDRPARRAPRARLRAIASY